jgi:general secretion pathway protein H
MVLRAVTVKIPTSETGSKSRLAAVARPWGGGAFRGDRVSAAGFTILELLIAISIVGLVMAVSVPATARFYQSIKYREAIRDVITTLASARYRAVNTGEAQDVNINPETNVLRFNKTSRQIPDNLNVAVHSSRELNRDDEGVIRFYPEGGSSGGDIDLERPDGSGIKISVDWLMGGVTQATYAID